MAVSGRTHSQFPCPHRCRQRTILISMTLPAGGEGSGSCPMAPTPPHQAQRLSGSKGRPAPRTSPWPRSPRPPPPRPHTPRTLTWRRRCCLRLHSRPRCPRASSTSCAARRARPAARWRAPLQPGAQACTLRYDRPSECAEWWMGNTSAESSCLRRHQGCCHHGTDGIGRMQFGSLAGRQAGLGLLGCGSCYGGTHPAASCGPGPAPRPPA